MVHLRIVVPTDRSEKVLDLLEAAPSTCNLVFLPGAARQPAGDVVYERRRTRHLRDGARAAAGLPADPRRAPSRR